VLLEGVLSGDNAILLAVLVRHLDEKNRKRALFFGLGGAFVFRLVAILLASSILQFWWLQALGAGYLVCLPIKHFTEKNGDAKEKKSPGDLWRTVIAVELTDIAFALDSVLAGVSFVGNRGDKLWIVYLGAIIGIVLLRFAANAFIGLLDKYPILSHVAYVLVGWIGVKLFVLATHSFDQVFPAVIPGEVSEMPAWLFWIVLSLIAIIGSYLATRVPKPRTGGLGQP
jgi:YkoY family integral membrane protein